VLKLPHPNPFVKLEKEVQPKLFSIFPKAQSETDSKGNHLMKGMWAYEFKNENGTLM